MLRLRRTLLSAGVVMVLSLPTLAGDGNRLAYLDEFCDPYWPGLDAARLVTPQWVGEPGVEAVVVLSVDDLVDTAAYEAFLRPIFARLQRIDGRAPVSLMTKHVEPRDPQLPIWLREGVSLEAHTYDHPCPCLQAGDVGKAKDTYDRCVDLMVGLPGSRAVAFRMPCCDSMNSPSPRFFAEIFNRTTPHGNFLGLDSSVCAVHTTHDPALPRALVTEQGSSRWTRYLPVDRCFANYIEDYPYPYVIARLCWEVPLATPDDWQGFHLHGAYHATTLADMRAALDAAVIKQGVYTLVFHPHHWIRNDQVVELIDDAVAKYGKRIKFLTLREVYQRLTDNLLGGQPLRASNGQDNGVRLLDLNADGYMDVVVGNERCRQTRLWSPRTGTWTIGEFPVSIVALDEQGNRSDAGVRFGVLRKEGHASLLVRNQREAGLWHFDGRAWVADPQGLSGLDVAGPVATSAGGRDQGVRLRDLDADGVCELIVGNPRQSAVLAWSEGRGWSRLPFAPPRGTAIVDAQGRDAGLRLVDIDADGRPDVVFSDPAGYSVDLFISRTEGWSRRVMAGPRGAGKELPPIVRADGTNNGAWFKYRQMWVQNEDTGKKLPNHVDVRSFVDDMLSGNLTRQLNP